MPSGSPLPSCGGGSACRACAARRAGFRRSDPVSIPKIQNLQCAAPRGKEGLMAQHNFEACLDFTLHYEGGYVDNPLDPGGATNRGVTRATLARFRGRPVSKADVMALGRDEAAAIYRKFYWDVVAGDDLLPGVDAVVFDHAVNSGPGAAIRALCNALSQPDRPRLDPDLLARVGKTGAATIIRTLCARRLSLLERLKTFRIFGRGWRARVAALEKTALAMVRP
jgi:lysozyme family protein